MRRWIIGSLLGAATLGAPVIPDGEMQLLYSYQYPIADEAYVFERNLINQVNTDQPKFNDTNGDGIISVSKFLDKKGKFHYEQIDESKYTEIGQKDGFFKNPKKAELISVLGLMTPEVAEAAIAFDALGDGGAATATSLTFAHTVTGTETLIAVGVYVSNSVVDGVTYNGAALTLIDNVLHASGNYVELYYKTGADTGANNVVISRTGTEDIFGSSLSYTGVNATGQPDDAVEGTEAAQTDGITLTLTTVADNSWGVMAGQQSAGGCQNGTNFTERTAGTAPCMGDNAAAITPAGSYAMTMLNNGSSSNWAAELASFAPAGAAPEATPNFGDIIIFE